MTSNADEPGASERDTSSGVAETTNAKDDEQEPEKYGPWDDGFRVSMFLLLVIGLPLFLASLYFVLYAIFGR